MLGLYALLGTQDQASIGATANLQDDVMAIYAEKAAGDEPSVNVHVVWRMRFDVESSAKYFVERLAPLGLQLWQVADELTISASSDAWPTPLSVEQLAECGEREQLEAALREPR